MSEENIMASNSEVPQRFQEVESTPVKSGGCGHGSCGCSGGGENSDKESMIADVEEALRDVIDPELGINIVDLGLLYGVEIEDEEIILDMTLTSAACPLTDVIEEQARQALAGFNKHMVLNWVWMPPWGPERITDDGREQLRALGFNV